MGIDGRIYPVTSTPKAPKDAFDFMDQWYPIQVKQKDKAGRPDIDSFEAVMARENRTIRASLTRVEAIHNPLVVIIIPT